RNELSGRWEWMLISGVIDLALAVMILAGFPGTAAWALGLLVGVNMMFGGAALVAMALAARQSPYPALRVSAGRRHLDAGERCELALVGGFLAHVARQIPRRVLRQRRHRHAERRHAAAERLRLHDLVELLVEPGDDRRRRLGRRRE